MIYSNNIIRESIWHEFGHFFIDLFLIKNPDFEITSFRFKHISPTKDNTWQFSVTSKNSKISSGSDLKKNCTDDDIGLYILSLYAGSIFESIYRRKFHNQYVNASRILSQGSAIHDAYKAGEIVREFQLTNEKTEKWKETREEVLESFFNLIYNNNHFLYEIQTLIDQVVIKVESQYVENVSFDIELSVEEVNILASKFKQIIKSTNIESDIYSLSKKIMLALS